MNYFEYRNGEMFAEGVPLKRIAQEVGTPAYVYSLATLKRHFRVFDEAFAAVPHIVCFSVKANSNIALLRAFAREGSGFDIVSGGELFRALKAGADPVAIEEAVLALPAESILVDRPPIEPQEAVAAADASGRIDRHPVHVAKMNHDAAVASRVASIVMSASADRDFEIGLARKPHCIEVICPSR